MYQSVGLDQNAKRIVVGPSPSFQWDQASVTVMSAEQRQSAPDLMGQILSKGNMLAALRRVKANRGAPGIDGMTVEELPEHLSSHWRSIRNRLMSGTYNPAPVRRVEIPKPDGGMRQLGIPSVLDRLVQQALLQVLTPIFDPTFSESSFGFRPGRSAHQAVRQAKHLVVGGYEFVVDLDLEKFFNTVQHDVLMRIVMTRVADKRVVKLIRKYLTAGVMIDGLSCRTEMGTPQGGPLSPLLSNLLLDQLDKELERRNLNFVRYADDCNIYVKSQKAAERVMSSISSYLEGTLKLKVNWAKSASDRPGNRKFLGFTIGNRGKVKVAKKSLERFKSKIREIIRPAKGRSIQQVFETLIPITWGWLNYFGVCETPTTLAGLGMWVRHRIRALQWRLWKKPHHRYCELIKLGITDQLARQTVASSKGPYRIGNSPALNNGLNLAWFRDMGLPDFVISK